MQNQTLIFSPKIEVRASNIEGFGVFAKEDILKGEILEESPFILFPYYTLTIKGLFDNLRSQNLLNQNERFVTNLTKNLGFKDPEDYYFKWMPKYQPDGEELVYTVLPLGFGPIYNTSNSDNNAEWKMGEKTFTFSASKDIKADEEICTFYGYFLDEIGNKYECDDVFNIALDYFDGEVKFKSIKFGTLSSFRSSQNDPFFSKIIEMFRDSASPIRIKKISALSASSIEQIPLYIPDSVSLKDLFSRLREFKKNGYAQVKFVFEYNSKIDSLKKENEVIWKK